MTRRCLPRLILARREGQRLHTVSRTRSKSHSTRVDKGFISFAAIRFRRLLAVPATAKLMKPLQSHQIPVYFQAGSHSEQTIYPVVYTMGDPGFGAPPIIMNKRQRIWNSCAKLALLVRKRPLVPSVAAKLALLVQKRIAPLQKSRFLLCD